MATYFGFDAYDVERGGDPFVFISYKSEDCDKVKVYARYLHDHGINVWYDNGLHAGSDWESYLMTVIEKPNCKAVLLFVSAKVAESTVIPLETTQARACKKPTVAVYLEPGLNLEVLLNKAIRVYVEQRQSVNAYIGTENSVCAEVLEAAKMAMSNTVSAAHSTAADTLWKNARMFLMNARRSRSEEDISRARGYLEQLTEQEPADHRGWLGLAMCACLRRAESLEAAHQQLKDGAKYYSYVVAAGADNIASPEYTEVKSRLWEEILDKLRQAFSGCAGLEEIRQLRQQAEQLGTHFGHTEQYLRSDYDRIVASMDERIRALEDEKRKTEEEAAEKAAKEAEIKAIVDQCEWEENADGGMTLKKYIGKSSSYDIPAEVDGRRVTKIGKTAFAFDIKNCKTTVLDGLLLFYSDLTSITIPDSVRSIDIGAFAYCTSLTSIAIPNSITNVGDNAFEGCTNLLSITIPDSVTSIGDDAFKGCKNLTVYSTGGFFSKAAKAARKSRVKYKRVKAK